jgi:radical SAM protein with 4Fe4S-binding SPASM domain
MIKVKNDALYLHNPNTDETLTIDKDKYPYLLDYIITNNINDYVRNLLNNNWNSCILDFDRLLALMDLSLSKNCPINSFYSPIYINLELTTACPLKCPQCYCNLDNAKTLDKEIAIQYIKEAHELGVIYINLSGGETMLYPDLFEVLKACDENQLKASVALSGYGFNNSVLDRFIYECNVFRIYISLNGSSEEVNSQTRNGYQMAIHSLAILKDSSYINYYINWVAHNNNIDDFNNMLILAEKYNVKAICILALKPNSNNEMESVPTQDNLIKLADYIKNYHGKVELIVEECYSALRLYMDREKPVECGAGRKAMSISVDGKFTPCRHINYKEAYRNIFQYWNNSPTLDKIRNIYKSTQEPCLSCKYEEKCYHCVAINYNIHNKIYRGNTYCSIAKLDS